MRMLIINIIRENAHLLRTSHTLLIIPLTLGSYTDKIRQLPSPIPCHVTACSYSIHYANREHAACYGLGTIEPAGGE